MQIEVNTEIKCPKCGYMWRSRKKHTKKYIICPSCLKRVKIRD